MNAKDIIADLEIRRKKIGLAAETLAKSAGVTSMTYRRWRAGDSVPRYDNLIALKMAVENAERELAS